jgi:peptide deformylase
VEKVDEELVRLSRDMVDTLHAAPGIGLAAPQVNVKKRLVVVDLSVGEDPDALIVLANPEIVSREGENICEEGCLSVPDIREKVSRPNRVIVRGLDMEGQMVEVEGNDLLARALCHEIDHLEGRLFIEYLSPLKKSIIKKKLQKARTSDE